METILSVSLEELLTKESMLLHCRDLLIASGYRENATFSDLDDFINDIGQLIVDNYSESEIESVSDYL